MRYRLAKLWAEGCCYCCLGRVELTWCSCVQVGLLETVKDLVFGPTVEVLYGAAFVAAQDMERLQQAFFDFEAGFELAASPVPHLLQRSFCSARRHLLKMLRQKPPPCEYAIGSRSFREYSRCSGEREAPCSRQERAPLLKYGTAPCIDTEADLRYYIRDTTIIIM